MEQTLQRQSGSESSSEFLEEFEQYLPAQGTCVDIAGGMEGMLFGSPTKVTQRL